MKDRVTSVVEHEVVMSISTDRDTIIFCSCGFSLTGLPEVSVGELRNLAEIHAQSPNTHIGIVARSGADRHVPRCTCGWIAGKAEEDYVVALEIAKEHWTRQNEIAFQKAREEATGVSYQEEFDMVKASYRKG